MPRSIIFILLLIAIYLVTKNLFRLFFPYFMEKFINNGRNNYQQYQQQHKEGTVTVNKKNVKKGKRIKSDEGDYVNYEDVK